jgi:hypothetical protein
MSAPTTVGRTILGWGTMLSNGRTRQRPVTEVFRWLVGARRAMPHRGRTLVMQRTERPLSRD